MDIRNLFYNFLIRGGLVDVIFLSILKMLGTVTFLILCSFCTGVFSFVAYSRLVVILSFTGFVI